MSRLIRLVIIAGFAVLLINCPSTPKPPENAVAAPTFTPAEGTYQAPQTVTIATATEGAQIRYTVDSSEPTATTGTEYTGPVPVSATTTIRAIAVRRRGRPGMEPHGRARGNGSTDSGRRGRDPR